MNDDQKTTEQAIDPEALTLARLLTVNPRSARALQISIERQQEKRAAVQRRVISATCPHCGSEGQIYLTLPSGVFRHRRADCCQPALRDAAEAALHNAMNPNSGPDSRIEASDRALLRELETHEQILGSNETRIEPVKRGAEHKPGYRGEELN